VHLKNPIVQKLWIARNEAKQRTSLTDSTQSGGNSQTTDMTKAAAAILKDAQQNQGAGATTASKKEGKHPKESETDIDYPFSQDEFLLETYRNPWGEMRFGKILEDLDALAGNIAFNHVEGNPLIVTAAVDRIRLKHNPVIGDDQTLSGKVTWVGKSSMEIRMGISTSTATNDGDEWLEAYFTFVVLDPETHKPIAVTPLKPETSTERAHFELGAIKARNKKIARKNQLRIGEQHTDITLQMDKNAAKLLEEAGPLLRMPSLADPQNILMDQTHQSNAMIAQPQVRNLHDRIFGGFLMRRAYELAFSTAYVFGGDKPRFLEVDDISFESPVDVGDLLVFNSRVLYTQPNGGNLGDYVQDHEGMPLVMVEVEAWVTVPERATAKVSNHFYFTFALPNQTSCRRVLPGNIDQARRQAVRMAADIEQAKLRS